VSKGTPCGRIADLLAQLRSRADLRALEEGAVRVGERLLINMLAAAGFKYALGKCVDDLGEVAAFLEDPFSGVCKLWIPCGGGGFYEGLCLFGDGCHAWIEIDGEARTVAVAVVDPRNPWSFICAAQAGPGGARVLDERHGCPEAVERVEELLSDAVSSEDPAGALVKGLASMWRARFREAAKIGIFVRAAP